MDQTHPMYKQFMDFIKSKEGETSQTSQSENPSYLKATENEDTEVYNKNKKEEVILLLEYSDLKWKNDPWQIMRRYLDKQMCPTLSCKYMMHYETILSIVKSAEINHFYPANSKEVFNFSKIVIKKIIASDEWGLSTLRESDYIHPIQKIPIKYNYWDYTESFFKVFLYENENKKHSWFIKICSHIFEQQIPNWFCKWWMYHGPTVEILPEMFKTLYLQWVDISPILKQFQKDDIYFEGISIMYFFIEFSIPWILKWNIEISSDEDNIPCLKRIFYTKFWNKIMQKGPEGNYHGQELIDSIKKAINNYQAKEEASQDHDMHNPFKQIARRLKMKKGLISKSELFASYMEEVKKDLKKTLELEFNDDDVSMTSGGKSMDEDICLTGESQAEDLEEDIAAQILQFEDNIQDLINSNKEESSTSKGKGKA